VKSDVMFIKRMMFSKLCV